MKGLSATGLLNIWERGSSATLVERALLILSEARPEVSWDDLAGLSIGARDSMLLRFYEETFGSSIQALCDCPGCGGITESSIDVGEILHTARVEEENRISLTWEDYDVRFRLPDSRDLAALLPVEDKALAAKRLFERCLIDARRDGKAILPDSLPPGLADYVSDRIARAEPQSDVELEMTCPVCQHSWVSAFDIAAFFWSVISTWAQSLLRDVHKLALAYGWSEEAILAMSAARRQAYLEMISS